MITLCRNGKKMVVSTEVQATALERSGYIRANKAPDNNSTGSGREKLANNPPDKSTPTPPTLEQDAALTAEQEPEKPVRRRRRKTVKAEE